MDPASVPAWIFEWIIGIAALMTAIETIRRNRKRVTTRLFSPWTTLASKIERIHSEVVDESGSSRFDALAREVAYIASEVRHNGGSTIKDSLLRIENLTVNAVQRQRAVMEYSPYGIFETDSAGDNIWVNTLYISIARRPAHELLGKNWFNAIAPRWRRIVTEEWYAAISDGRIFDMAYEIVTPDGELVPVHCRSTIISDREGNLAHIVGFVHQLDSPVEHGPEQFARPSLQAVTG